jgi:hypothetical protein
MRSARTPIWITRISRRWPRPAVQSSCRTAHATVCLRDPGMEAAIQKIRSVFVDQKHPERFQSQFYDVPHQFNVEMQNAAFAWLEKWLSKAK